MARSPTLFLWFTLRFSRLPKSSWDEPPAKTRLQPCSDPAKKESFTDWFLEINGTNGTKAFYLAYEKSHVSLRTPYDGIEAALQLLKSRSVHIAVVTGKGPVGTNLSLERLGIIRYFDLIRCGSASGGVKALALREVLDTWKLPPREVAFVGDSQDDMRDAKEVGVVGLGAGWDRSANLGELERDASMVFRSVSDLVSWIELHC